MRISKDPEIRKQEMIDTAMKLFAEKGYEFTSMSDIAREMNVVSGLCYRYFRSKEELYNTALDMYSKECSAPIIKLLCDDYDDINDFLDIFSKNFINTDGKEKYHDFFHGSKNELFHKQLEVKMAKIIEPCFISLLNKWNQRGVIKIKDIENTAKFILQGQMPIINDDSISSDKKAKIVKNLVLKILK